MIGASTERFLQETRGAKALLSEMILQSARDYHSTDKTIRHNAYMFIISDDFEGICDDLDVCCIKLRKKILNGRPALNRIRSFNL